MTALVSNRVFLEAAFVDALPGTYTIFTGFAEDPYSAPRSAWFGAPWSPGEKVPRRFDLQNSYLTVSTFEPDAQTGECRRRKALFDAMHIALLDDVGTKIQRDRVRLLPSAVIETSPGNEQHFLFIKQDAASRERAMCERLIDRMIGAGLTVDGRDSGMRGVTRFARLPCGVNSKGKYVRQIGHAFQVRCLSFNPERRYSIAEIAAAWQLDLSAPPTFRASVTSITPATVRAAAHRFDALLATFRLMNMHIGQRGIWHDVVCPWVSEHTDRCTTGTAIAEPSAENAHLGGFVCFHGHCQQPKRTMADVRRWCRELARLLDERRGVQ